MDRLQRRRKRRKRIEELYIARRFYREARREGYKPLEAFMIVTGRLMKRIYLPVVTAAFSEVNTLRLHRILSNLTPPTGKNITKEINRANA